jgi:hypothetical protein
LWQFSPPPYIGGPRQIVQCARGFPFTS